MKQRINIKPPSVNRAWKGRRYKTKDYKIFEAELMLLLKPRKVEGKNLKVDFVFGLSNRLSDLDNCIKQTLDIICKKFDFDDRDIYELRARKKIVKKGAEFIEFKITK